MNVSGKSTVKDFFNMDRHRDESVCRYKDWNMLLGDGTTLTGCVTNYIVNRRLAVAYFELFLNEDDPERAATIIFNFLFSMLNDRQFLLPKTLKEHTVKIRERKHDVMVRYNQVPVLPTMTIYATARIELTLKELLVEKWREQGMELKLIDQNYVDGTQEIIRPHAFICHSFKDKDRVARPLAEQLREKVGPIWYDEFSLKIGDSLRDRIENGLKHSSRCIIILSKNFLKNESWARREFDSIYTREIVEKQNVILPVWVNVTPKLLYEYSPILADRFGVNWSDGIDEVVEKLRHSLIQKVGRDSISN